NRLGKNLLLDPAIEDKKLTMSLKNITAMEALTAILEAHDLAYREMRGDVYYVAKSEKIGKQTIVKNVPLKYASAVDLQPIVQTMIISESGAVMSDKRTNTLVIKESLDIIHEMEKLIIELDRPTKQVYIQAEIVEVSSTNDQELGVEWLWNRSGAVESRVGTDFGLQAVTTTTEGQTPQQVTDGFPFPAGTGLGVGILNTNVEAVLKALHKTNNVNLLSRPRVMTMDNQESTIEVGDQIPFQKLNQFGVTSFEFKDATVQLLVKPHIVDSNYVMLQVSPKADFQNGFTPDGTPIISTRKASTNVKVRDGQTIVIGGLIRDSLIKSESKVPVLGSIPLLGLLFKSKKSTKIKTELIVFITPIIIGDGVTNTLFNNEFKLKHDLEKKLN
ncbi:hypothetical protein MJD09_13980, partial [bacterium]|nr:hypothetical protein [bacterium]